MLLFLRADETPSCENPPPLFFTPNAASGRAAIHAAETLKARRVRTSADRCRQKNDIEQWRQDLQFRAQRAIEQRNESQFHCLTPAQTPRSQKTRDGAVTLLAIDRSRGRHLSESAGQDAEGRIDADSSATGARAP
jgi:hypothetical protein